MNMNDNKNGRFFDDDLLEDIRKQFCYLEEDAQNRKRLFFENAGGSLRLKKCVEAKAKYEEYPDCPERIHDTALVLKKIQEDGTRDIIEVIFGGSDGSLVTELSDSQTMFQMAGAVAENVSGTNIVTTVLEHPSAFDAARYYAEKTGKEFRVAMANKETGYVDVEEVLKHVDKDTCFLSVMYASNISGSIMDIESIIKEARKVKPDLYVLVDAVQHAPHGPIHADELGIDGINFAPYKAFGIRGCGYAYVSKRLAELPHHKLIAKGKDVWELGTPAPANFAAVIEQVNYVCWVGQHFTDSTDRRTQYVTGMNHIHLHEQALLERMLNGTAEVPGLRKQKGVTVHMDFPDLASRDIIIAMSIEGLDFVKTVEEYGKRGITVYERVNTSVYSKRMLEAFDLEGAIRVSPLHCHNKEDVDRFLKVTMEIAANV